jgi:hypothetical protein
VRSLWINAACGPSRSKSQDRFVVVCAFEISRLDFTGSDDHLSIGLWHQLIAGGRLFDAQGPRYGHANLQLDATRRSIAVHVARIGGNFHTQLGHHIGGVDAKDPWHCLHGTDTG